MGTIHKVIITDKMAVKVPPVGCLLLLSLLLRTVMCLDLGHGGVYDSDEAKLYWEKRFGNLFSDLASIQKKAMSRTQSPVISEPPLLEPALVTELEDNEVEEVEEGEEEVTATSTPVYPIIYYHYYPSNT